jgi:hypothetical protein
VQLKFREPTAYATPRTRLRSFAARALLVCAALLTAGSIVRAVTVTPSAVYIDHRTRSGTMTLFNPGERPAEVTIAFAFGYPVSDEHGSVGVPLVDEAPAGEPSAVPWLRAFPRRLIIEPGQRQVVRIFGEPPADLPDGEYWARALISSRGGQPPIEEIRGDMRVAITLETVIATAVTYRKGTVTTGVVANRAVATATDSTVSVLLDLERTGNAAFLGRLRAEVVARDGTVLGVNEDYLAVYRSLRFRLVVPVLDRTRLEGATVRYVLDTERPDLPPAGPLRAQEVRGTLPVQRGG